MSEPTTAAGRALLQAGFIFGSSLPDAPSLAANILAIEAEALGEGMLRQLERQIADEAAGHEPVMSSEGGAFTSESLSPEAEEYIAMRQKGRRLPSRKELLQRLDDCEQALRDTERALASGVALDVERLADALVMVQHGVPLGWNRGPNDDVMAKRARRAFMNQATGIAAEYVRLAAQDGVGER